MAQAWTLVDYEDQANGKVPPGTKIDLPRETDADKAEFERLKEYGVVTTTEPKATDPDESATPAEPPTSRRRRPGGS